MIDVVNVHWTGSMNYNVLALNWKLCSKGGVDWVHSNDIDRHAVRTERLNQRIVSSIPYAVD
jgi:hypothetical protein